MMGTEDGLSDPAPGGPLVDAAGAVRGTNGSGGIGGQPVLPVEPHCSATRRAGGSAARDVAAFGLRRDHRLADLLHVEVDAQGRPVLRDVVAIKAQFHL